MTKTGPTQARRALIAGAWASRDPATVSRPLPRRLENLPKPLQESRWQAQGRWCTRVRRLLARGKHAHHVVGAMARDRVGCMWAMAQQVPVPRSVPQTARPWMHRIRVSTAIALERCRHDTCRGVGVSRSGRLHP